MAKLSRQHRSRTGQREHMPIAVASAAYNPGGSVPAQSTPYTPGNGNGNGRPMNGGCGYTGPATPQSWGAACPTGFCRAEDLATAVGRQFAGEKYPCRELCYWVRIALDAAGAGTVNENARITICPSRVIGLATTSAFVDSTGNTLLTRFEIGNQNQIVGDPIKLEFLIVQSYGIIPFVTDCLKSGTPLGFSVTGGPANGFAFLGIIGPAIG